MLEQHCLLLLTALTVRISLEDAALVFLKADSYTPCHSVFEVGGLIANASLWKMNIQDSPFLSHSPECNTCINSPVEFIQQELRFSPEACNAVSFGLDNVLLTVASNTEEDGMASADALPPRSCRRFKFVWRQRKFLRFIFGGKAFQFWMLPFSLASAPCKFTKCMDAALAPLKLQDIHGTLRMNLQKSSLLPKQHTVF